MNRIILISLGLLLTTALAAQKLKAPNGVVPLKTMVTPDSKRILFPFIGDTVVIQRFGSRKSCSNGTCSSDAYMTYMTRIPGFKPPCTMSTSVAGTDVLCNGDATGKLTLTVVNGKAPFTYEWSNGATTPGLVRVSAGAYCVTITDSLGCQATACGIVSEPTKLQTEITSKNAQCFGDVGSVDLSVTGGTAPYRYTWSNGTTSEDLSVQAGGYRVTVEDYNGCTTTASAFVTQPDSLKAKPLVIDATCSKDRGTIILTVTGGTGPYIYNWSSNAATRDLVNVKPVTYWVTVTDANGCITKTTAMIAKPSCGFLGNVSLFGEAMFSTSLGRGAITNNWFWQTYRVGGESRPWHKPLDFEFWLGFHPASNFDWPSEVAPEDDWCPCNKNLRKVIVSGGFRASLREDLGEVWGGKWGIRPYVSYDRWITKPAMPKGFRKDYNLPGALTTGLLIYWQAPLWKDNGELAKATVTLSTGGGWQWLRGARQGPELEFLKAKLSFGHGAKPGKDETPDQFSIGNHLKARAAAKKQARKAKVVVKPKKAKKSN